MSPPLPPFDREVAPPKLRMTEDAWNFHDQKRGCLAYTSDSRCDRSEFLKGRREIVDLLTRKRAKELV